MVDETLPLDTHLCFALYRGHRAMTRAYAPVLEPLGLTYPQFVTLLALWEVSAPVSVGELGERLGLDSGTLTPLLKRLEQAGLVERRRDPADERRVLISLTPTGAELRPGAFRAQRAVAQQLQLDRSQVNDLRDRLIALTDTIERAVSGSSREPAAEPAPS